ncbi:hypothetical protein CY34DRAFT_800703 [Suillus luteus UH-Slu-Lm8-n1]|uniref:Uncharacterized protein n=1 Tax=Suillus luteus UH-Slu-Lm8-n1 TaxID=930992 RepID=A0A0D0A7W6_9AGAM|nr:hypothetical protein CY34DRAFT_800703 [Suillus luteus UH-Slu-Lm8-n1]
MQSQSSHQSQSHFAGLERTSSAQDKAMLQRQYRTKEAHALAQLQKLLRDISQVADTHQTRLATIVQATDMIKFLYFRNNMVQELHELPRLEPGHGATVAVDCHLDQCSLADWQWGNDHVDERQQH